MGQIRVNPTRMELKKLKTRLTTARRGHKLLKDKRDELMRRFMENVRECAVLREAVEEKLRSAYRGISVANAVSTPEMLLEALILPRGECRLSVGRENVMSVSVPTFKLEKEEGEGDVPFGYAFTSPAIDTSIAAFSSLSEDILRLAVLEKRASLLSEEIERTRRRVNALEHIMIPQYEETIRDIGMKLDENERGSRTRLMKVKDMMLKRQYEAKALPDEEA